MREVDYSNFMMAFRTLVHKVDTLVEQQRQIITLLKSIADAPRAEEKAN